MDKASFTIDRHTPIIPESHWYGLPPQEEELYTKLKNDVILPIAKLNQPFKFKRKVPKDIIPRTISNAMLAESQMAMLDCVGKLEPHHIAYLTNRGFNNEDIFKYQICSTKELVGRLHPDTVSNLTLSLPKKLIKHADSTFIDGLSFPCFHLGLFWGFATRILNHPAIKYSFSIPHRLCFGIETNHDEVYVVEGIFDAIAMKRRKFNALGMGDSQPNYFKMMVVAKFNKIRLLFDDDYAGWLGALKAYTILTTMLSVDPSRIDIVGICGGHDPDIAIRNGTFDPRKFTIEETQIKTKAWKRAIT